MRSARALLLAVIASLAGCKDTTVPMCNDPDPSAAPPSCVEVCAHLFSMTCRVGGSAAECEMVCDSSGAAAFPQVMRCYQAADNCDDVDACSRGCGPDASPVPFTPTTLGPDATDDQDGG